LYGGFLSILGAGGRAFKSPRPDHESKEVRSMKPGGKSGIYRADSMKNGLGFRKRERGWVIKTRSEYRISSLDCLRGPISGYDVK